MHTESSLKIISIGREIGSQVVESEKEAASSTAWVEGGVLESGLLLEATGLTENTTIGTTLKRGEGAEEDGGSRGDVYQLSTFQTFTSTHTKVIAYSVVKGVAVSSIFTISPPKVSMLNAQVAMYSFHILTYFF